MSRLDLLAMAAARLGHVVLYVPPTETRGFALVTATDPRGVK